jgi:FkbM family methyltransferase
MTPLLWHAPEAVGLQARRAAARLMVGRLPSMVADYPDGRRFFVPERDAMYGQLLVLGEYEPVESAFVRRVLSPGDLAIDIGANHGWFSILMATAVGAEGTVLAVEPLPPMLEALERNLGLNPDLRVDVERVALGPEPGSVELHIFAGLPHGHASAATFGRSDYSSYDCQVRTLDAIVAERGGRSPALIKMDVEGAELGVLQGARDLLAGEDAPLLMFEVNRETASAFGYRPQDLLGFVEARGYTSYRLEPSGLSPETEPAAAPRGTAWVCVPESKLDRVGAAAGLAGSAAQGVQSRRHA